MARKNIVSTGANNSDMLALIVFSIIFGYALSRVPGKPGATLLNFWQGVYQVMLRITDVVMRFAPIGVFALVARVVAMTEWDQLVQLFNFFLTVLSALAIHTFPSRAPRLTTFRPYVSHSLLAGRPIWPLSMAKLPYVPFGVPPHAKPHTDCSPNPNPLTPPLPDQLGVDT